MPELLEAWLVLASVSYHGNVQVSILVNQWLVLVMPRATGSWSLRQIDRSRSIASPKKENLISNENEGSTLEKHLYKVLAEVISSFRVVRKFGSRRLTSRNKRPAPRALQALNRRWRRNHLARSEGIIPLKIFVFKCSEMSFSPLSRLFSL